MASLGYKTKQAIEELFDMKTGYVIDFTNNTFQTYIKESIDIDIYCDKGYEEYLSKANKLRQIFEMESNGKVSKLIIDLLDYYEDYKLKRKKLTDYDRKKIKDIKKDIRDLEKNDEESITLIEELEELIPKISTRNAQFYQMPIDEKLKEIGNLIEHLLKKDKKFITLNYEYISSGFIKESDVKNLRKKVQCFRHSSQESIEERNTYTYEQKKFMIEYGIVICNLIYNELKNN